MVRPERRTKSDLAAVALIMVAVLTGAVVLWQHSDARATVSRTAPPVAEPATATAVPATLREIWRAPSGATPEPVIAGPAVVTAAGGDVLGRDPLNGRVRWHYARDLPLCTVSSAWDHAIAVYRKSLNCSEVTALEGSTGKRGPQRNSDADLGTRLLDDGTYVTTAGNMIESWRSDLVRTQQYGIPLNVRNPDNGLPRPECRRTSVAVGDERVGVIEECPREGADRLTVIKTRPEDDETPEEVLTTTVGSREANVVSVNDERVAVVLRDQNQLVVRDTRADETGRFGLPPLDPSVGDGVESLAAEQLRTVLLDPRQSRDLPKVAKSLATALRDVAPAATEQAIMDAAARTPDRAFQVAALRESDFERVDESLDGLAGVSFAGTLFWHTGTDTIALNASHFTPLWTAGGTLGPGALFGGKLLVPVPDGLAVTDPSTGVQERVIPVDRQGYTGPVTLDSVGTVLLEKRGDVLVALN